MAAASQLAKAPGVAVLAGAAVLLAILNLQLLRTPVDVSPIAPPASETDPPRPDSGRPATALDTRTAEQFQATVGRPLFNPSRRPVPRREAAETRPNAGVGDFRLVGVMRAADQPPRALLRSANAANGRWIAEGAEFNGWTLHKVDERSVVLKSGARSQELKLAAPRRAPMDDVPAAKQ